MTPEYSTCHDNNEMIKQGRVVVRNSAESTLRAQGWAMDSKHSVGGQWLCCFAGGRQQLGGWSIISVLCHGLSNVPEHRMEIKKV